MENFRQIENWGRQSFSEPEFRKQLELGLIAMLGSNSTFEAKRFACKQLGAFGSQKALPQLARLLRDEQTAGIACLALTTYPPGKTDEALRAAVGSTQGNARIQIINTLGDRRDSGGVHALQRFLRGQDASIAEAALAALGKIGNRAAWKAINSLSLETKQALKPSWTVAMLRCAGSLEKSGDERIARRVYEELIVSSEQAYVRRAALQGLLKTDKDEGEGRIFDVLHGSDSVLKPVAIAAVRALRSEGASTKFAAELPVLEAQEQVWLIESLAARGDAGARAGIGKALGSPELIVRQAAVSALGRIGDASTVALFAGTLQKSQEPEVRQAIESAVVDLGGGKETDKAIAAELQKSAGETRVHLMSALARREGASANALLLREAASPDPAVAKAAFRNLARTASASDLPVLISKICRLEDASMRSEAEGAAMQALGRMGSDARRSAIVCDALAHAKSAESRKALLGLLPVCADAEALNALKAAADDPNAEVSESAMRALADWPDISGWDVLIGHYQHAESEKVRAIVLGGLVRLAGEENAHPDQRLMDRYQQLLLSAHGATETKLILGALSGASSPGALQLVIPLLSNSSVRAEAEVAVKRIAEAIKAQHPQEASEALQKLEAKK
jgi:HEAT repeat protein